MILAREKRLALQHFCENTSRAPDVDFHIVLLPREHDLRCSVVSRRDIASHLRILYACQAEVADFEVAVLVNEDVGGLEIAVDDAGGVDVFEAALALSEGALSFRASVVTYQDLVEKVLDELLL